MTVAVRVTADAARRIRAGHPWVFDRSVIAARPNDAAVGTLAAVFDPERRFAGIGLYDPGSPIRVRVLAAGAPTVVDDAFLAERVVAAVRRRGALAADARTSAYRLVHGENDGLPGLVVDRYEDLAVVHLDTAAWQPHLDAVVGALVDCTGVHTVLRRGSRHSGVGPPIAIVGTLPDGPVTYRENGLRLVADVVAGQKTGAFLDQRDNRARVRDLSGDAQVLDVFCCTGGFGLHAAAGGARSVLSVDLAPAAVAAARAAMAANDDLAAVRACRHETVVGDAFVVLDALRRERRQFDVVVIDPPSFANKATAVPAALRAYARLAAAGRSVTVPGGTLVLASCSSRVDAATFEQTVSAATGDTLEIVERTAAPDDHPVGFPEGAYLKALFTRRR